MLTESLRWVDPILSVLHSVHSIPIIIEADSVHIDLEPYAIRKNKRVWRFSLLDWEPLHSQEFLELRNIQDRYNNINVLVYPSLRL